MTQIDAQKTIFQLVKETPQIIEILTSLGFYDITNPAILHTVGKVMTIKKAIKMKKQDKNKFINVFSNFGYDLINL